MGMDLEATLGYGIQLHAFEEEPMCDLDTAEELYWNNELLKLAFGGFECGETFLLYTPSVISAGDYTPESFDELPKLDTIADEILRNACVELGIVQDFKWWLIPNYG